MIHYRAFGDDQADAGFGTATIVIDHILTRHAIGREIAGHRSHGYAIAQLEVVKFKRLKQRTKIHTHVMCNLINLVS